MSLFKLRYIGVVGGFSLRVVSVAISLATLIASSNASLWPTSRLLAANIVVQVWGAQPVLVLPREVWVGRWYAYQLSIYYHAIKAVSW